MLVILYIVPDKQGIHIFFFLISPSKHIRNASGAVFLMSIHNICFVESRGASNEYLQQMFP